MGSGRLLDLGELRGHVVALAFPDMDVDGKIGIVLPGVGKPLLDLVVKRVAQGVEKHLHPQGFPGDQRLARPVGAVAMLPGQLLDAPLHLRLDAAPMVEGAIHRAAGHARQLRDFLRCNAHGRSPFRARERIFILTIPQRQQIVNPLWHPDY